MGSGNNVLGGGKFYYSTDEKIIGQWVDGKPLYQKCYTGLSIATGTNAWSSTGINVASLNIDKLVLCNGFGSARAANGGTALVARCYINSNVLYIALTYGGHDGNVTDIVIQYTKTTDVAQ